MELPNSEVSDVSSVLLMSYPSTSNEGECHDVKFDVDMIEQMFYKQLVEYDEHHSGSNRKPWTHERILEVITDLKNIKMTVKKKSVNYYWLNKYEIVTTENEEFLIAKKKNHAEPTVRIVAREQYFDLLSEVHASCKHGGRDKMLQEIKNKFYIPKKAIEIFVSLCPVCNMNKKQHKKDNMLRPIASGDLGEEGKFDLLDFQCHPDGEFNWLLCYQNITTKFIILRPLKSANIAEVASELLITFLTLGSPNTLYSDLDDDFTINVIKELTAMWPQCVIALGSQYQNSHAESSSSNSSVTTFQVQMMLHTWMNENNSTNWSVGCFFVQYYKNVSIHHKLGKLSYKSFSGFTKNDFNSSSIVKYTVNEADELVPNSLPDHNSSSIVKCTANETDEIVPNSLPDHHSSPIVKYEADELVPNSLPDQETIEQIQQNIKIEIDTSSNLSDTHNDLVEKDTENVSNYAHKCTSCNGPVHIIHGVLNDNQDQRLKVFCYVCNTEQVIDLEKTQGLKRPAEVTVSEKVKITALDIGQSVDVSIPKSSRGPLNTKIIKGKIVDFQCGVYRVATNIGTIKNWFPRSDLRPNETDYGEVLKEPVTLDEAVASQPAEISHKCNCKPAVNQCYNNRCYCYKNKVLCGSKCHQRLMCVNT